MSCGNLSKGIASTGQMKVDRTPAYDRKWKRRTNQVVSKAGVIRPDKRNRVRYI